MSVTGTGAGSLSVSGSGTAYAYPCATGAGSLSISGDATSYAYATGAGAGSLSVSGSGSATAHPAAVGDGSLSVNGTGVGAGYAAGVGSGLLSVSGSAAGGPVVTGTGDGSLSITGDGGDTPRATGAGSLSLTGNGIGMAQPAASGIWLYVHTAPPVQIYERDELRSRLRPGLPMLRVPFTVSPTAARLGQTNDSFGVTLDRPSERLRGYLAAQGPYGVRVDVMDGGEVSRSGIVASVAAGADGSIDLDCEGAGWSTDLPLRTNADLGEFRDAAVLPWRFGRAVSGRLVRLNAAGTRWLWADHASSAIRSVTADGQPYDGWQWRNAVDGTGHPYTLVETVDGFDEGAELTAIGDGSLDPQNGLPMTNPADVAYALCVYAGVTVDRGAMVAFRSECQARGLEVAGSIDGGTLQAALTSIAESIYAAFGRGMPGLMRLRPRTAAQATIPARDTPTAAGQREGIATRVRVRYALDDGKPRASLEVRAPAVEALRGAITSEAVLPWVSDARVAADVAGRLIADRARPRYTMTAARQQRRYYPGETASVTVTAIGLSGVALVTASAVDERGSVPTLELAVGDSPATEILSSAVAYSPEVYTGATVATQGTDRIIGPITDTAGRPIAGATCVLDGSVTRTTDGAGKVAFTLAQMPAGQHVIDITAPGMQPMRLTVTV